MIWKPHVTVAAIVEKNNKFLLVEEMINHQLLLNQPAGHLEPDESLIDAVIRETQEETAYHFMPQSIVSIMLWKNTDNNESFLRVVFSGEIGKHDKEQALDDGIVRTVWKTQAELQQLNCLRSPLVLKSIEDYLTGKSYSLGILDHIT